MSHEYALANFFGVVQTNATKCKERLWNCRKVATKQTRSTAFMLAVVRQIMKVFWNRRDRGGKAIDDANGDVVCRSLEHAKGQSLISIPSDTNDVHYCKSEGCLVCRLSKTLSFVETNHVSPQSLRCMPTRWWDKQTFPLFVDYALDDDDTVPYDEKHSTGNSFVESIALCLQSDW